MKIRNVLRIAFVAIRRNSVRSALTMLGVIIGVASVIAMISLGSGARASIDEQIQAQGTNVIYVSSGSFESRVIRAVEACFIQYRVLQPGRQHIGQIVHGAVHQKIPAMPAASLHCVCGSRWTE